MPHHTKAPSGSPVFRIAAAGALRGYVFRSLDAGEEGHGGVWSRWGAGICVFGGGLKVYLPQAMEFEETKPQMNADERRLNALSEEIACAAHL
jgi:hypothetical protein